MKGEIMTKQTSEPATAQDVEQAKILVTIKESEKFLGTGKDYDVEHLLKGFEIDYICKIENEETKDLKTLTDAKNICLRHKIEEMIEETGRFDLVIPFEDVCKDCGGSGELYKFFRKTVEVECRVCEGAGKKVVKCKSCHGTSRFRKDDGKGLRINVLCKTCKGENMVDDVSMVELKCKKCRGKGQVRKIALDAKIKSTTFCRTCKGRGFNLPKKAKPPSNPVISADLADAIKDKIIDAE